MIRLVLFLAVIPLIWASNARAVGIHPNLLAVPEFSQADLGEDGDGALALFKCPCPASEGVSLERESCSCVAAEDARSALREGIQAEKASSEILVVAQVNGILEALEESPELKRSLIFEQEDFQYLWDTTRSICPAELMKVYRIGPISCRIRDVWKMRFQTLLSMGLSTEAIFGFYVREVNADREQEDHYHAHDLKYVPAGNSPVAIPALIAVVAAALFWFSRRRQQEKSDIKGAGTAAAPAEPVTPKGLSEAEAKLLAAELDDSEEF